MGIPPAPFRSVGLNIFFRRNSQRIASGSYGYRFHLQRINVGIRRIQTELDGVGSRCAYRGRRLHGKRCLFLARRGSKVQLGNAEEIGPSTIWMGTSLCQSVKLWIINSGWERRVEGDVNVLASP